MPLAHINGIELYYEVHGEGPALVLAHGGGGNHLSWWQQVPALAKHYRCITFDHRGFGSSRDLDDGPGPDRLRRRSTPTARSSRHRARGARRPIDGRMDGAGLCRCLSRSRQCARPMRHDRWHGRSRSHARAGEAAREQQGRASRISSPAHMRQAFPRAIRAATSSTSRSPGLNTHVPRTC